ncbi:U3 small nucleolar RNA-associated protein 23 [Geosmithia morbida]|uniref:U3 small nucleolar RNA-associated protein 23 n=1 Tax=Geosmithia morbida TaxID=1094350 RepID=A0A9P5D4Z6_9HYPO|nr:U3 small nucleolar RNA-associated protein 23 [Geosmithia morbida]KAF4124051.1 U3 small nucleolar RNA-associated protein 23 [Geosmithia morbida]
MRGKRSKQYRKLMSQYQMTFGFREPYQCLVDAEMVRDSCRFKMELAPALERTVHGKVKPSTLRTHPTIICFFPFEGSSVRDSANIGEIVITQCEIRKLYGQNSDPGAAEAIEVAKTFERRRCGHHPDEYPEPLSTEECLESVVDPKKSGTNKHRYVVASQDNSVRRMLRSVRGTPLIYVKRSVMILEPMADESVQVRAREERAKFRAEIRKPVATGKRKRDDEDDEADGDEDREGHKKEKNKKIKTKGPKGPNPLSVKKSKKKDPAQQNKVPAKRKRRRKGTSSKGEQPSTDGAQATEAVTTTTTMTTTDGDAE